jgi:HK97 family phage prohead protease
MNLYEYKNSSATVLDVDDASRRVKVVMNEMGLKDLDGDVIDPKAFNRTIKQRGPGGADLIWHLTDHMPMMKNAVGKPREILAQDNKLIFVTDIAKTTWGTDVLEMYKAGTINQHSIGFRTLQSEPVNAGTNNEHRLIKEILLYEGSAVLWGANPATPTLSVGKSLTKEQAEKKYSDTLKELDNLAVLFKNGRLSDETGEMIEMRMAQLTSTLKQLYEATTQPAASAPDPVAKSSLLDVLTTFNKTFTTTGHEKSVHQT